MRCRSFRCLRSRSETVPACRPAVVRLPADRSRVVPGDGPGGGAGMTAAEAARHRLGPVGEVPVGEGRSFVVAGEQVAVCRLRDGSLRATQAVCPHAGGPLADGQTDVDVLVCPLHLYAYKWSDGSSTSGAAPVRLFPVREVDGQVVVEV